MFKIKINGREFQLTAKDRILDNGSCYTLLTQTVWKDHNNITPRVPKAVFKKLVKEGKVVRTDKVYRNIFGQPTKCVIYDCTD